MSRKIKFGKIAIVIFLTGLIWIWADLEQQISDTLDNVVTISIDESTNPSLWATFKVPDGTLARSVSVTSVQIKGPASKIQDVKQNLSRGLLDLSFSLFLEQQGMTEPGEHPLDVQNFLRQSDKIRQLGLTVELCEPQRFVVQVIQLVKKNVIVECIDENSNPLSYKNINPATVNAYVPADQTLTAKVQLSKSEIEQARRSAVTKIPYIVLPGPISKPVAEKVQVELPPPGEQPESGVPAILGFCFSKNLQGRYAVKVENEPDFATVRIKASPAAKDAYLSQPFQLILFIVDDDVGKTDTQSRPVVFNFPVEFVRRGEIERAQDPPVVKFQLVLLSSGPAAGETTE